nr:TIR domain-containing protein [Candidatus Aminicenantes bacterium]NIM79825.1 TIR domain-containing protein [Candidatus Aminicenantes bacterium]NIN19155.1 TIR domain-containing protein [Candidatus Aminicenantes bacterium]NIN43059.1 TIR domain-containing protein [Candidatus Aminicenantes bacterium]NIN85800.1 TIR domain-containing protein [Candidatus Aminicenantes bacterium]
SYAFEDIEIVEKEIVSTLNAHGISTWFDKENIRVSDYFERKILDGLKTCEWFLLAMSPNSAKSEWVKDELHWAFKNKKENILPLIIKECDPEEFHVRLGRMYCARYDMYPDQVMGELVRRVLY